MSQLTASERAFEHFCTAHGIVYERVPATQSRTPDYLITLGGQQIVTEIKQIDPNPEEQREITDFAAKGWIVGGKGAPGDRIRKVIDHANTQIKTQTKGRLPSLVVVCDNVPHASHTAPYCILVAMYGLQQYNLHIQHDPSQRVRLVGVSFGGKRQMTPSSNTSTSAVAVLRGEDPAHCMLDVYHNIHALVQLNPAVFGGLPVRQYTLPAPNSGQFQDWIEIEDLGSIG